MTVQSNGTPVVDKPLAAIPTNVILEVHNMISNGMTKQAAVSCIRQGLIPKGYTPHTFRRNTPESYLDMLRSIVATYLYRDQIDQLKNENVDFSTFLYVPEIDPIMGTPRHDRSDHNHLFRRVAKSVREGKDNSLNYQAFDDVLLDSKSGLTHAALIGKRKQSLVDAERLLSYHVVKSLRTHGHEKEAKHVEVVANWHEASDGRGITQLRQCKYNYLMLQYILDEWMPWHRSCYDFSTIDINRYIIWFIIGFSVFPAIGRGKILYIFRLFILFQPPLLHPSPTTFERMVVSFI